MVVNARETLRSLYGCATLGSFEACGTLAVGDTPGTFAAWGALGIINSSEALTYFCHQNFGAHHGYQYRGARWNQRQCGAHGTHEVEPY